MIVCSRCGKENQANYKFCLGCGNDLVPASAAAVVAYGGHGGLGGASDLDAIAAGWNLEAERVADEAPMAAPAVAFEEAPPASFAARGQIAVAATVLAEPPVSALALTPSQVEAVSPSGSHLRACPTCGNQVAVEFVFCGQCGMRLGAESARAPLPRSLFAAQNSAPAVRGKLVLIRPDGSEGGSFSLGEGETTVGRIDGALFETDTYLSPRHGVFAFRGTTLYVRDAGSLNGVFVKMSGEEEIADGEVFRMGQELLRFDVIRPPQPLEDGTEVMGSPNPGYWGRIAVIIGRGQDAATFPIAGDALVIGRERGDVLFPEDGYVSGTHARLSRREGRYFLADLNSSNGSFMRIRGERALRSGTFLLLGQQLFRIQYS